ncbi:MAG: hypothetical protein NC402_08045 [Prevotella sp.]|nr:hypothetical protein [Prevotella sp.]
MIRFIYDFSEVFARVKARVAMLNLNLAQNLDAPSGRISMTENIDKPLLRFSFVSAAHRVVNRLRPWLADFEWDENSAIIKLDIANTTDKLNTVIFNSINETLYLLTLADKLTYAAPPLQDCTKALRVECLQRADSLLTDMASAFAITEN